MTAPAPTLLFDFIDPLSYLIDVELRRLTTEEGIEGPARIPCELRSPPETLLDPAGPWWQERWAVASALARERGIDLVRPFILPWTRKAHELVEHAREHGRAESARIAIFAAVFERGEDIGRVDVLLGLCSLVDLNPTEARVVLDVDRHAGAVAEYASVAAEVGIAEPPALVHGSSVLRGFHNRDALRTFLCSS